jgi:hypothetical protein
MIASATISKLSMQDSPDVVALKQAFRKESDPATGLSVGIFLALVQIVLGIFFFTPLFK